MDDDAKQIAYVRSIGKRGFQISAYRRGSAADPAELERLHAEVRSSKGWLARLLGG